MMTKAVELMRKVQHAIVPALLAFFGILVAYRVGTRGGQELDLWFSLLLVAAGMGIAADRAELRGREVVSGTFLDLIKLLARGGLVKVEHTYRQESAEDVGY